jgi:hypothetical protein
MGEIAKPTDPAAWDSGQVNYAVPDSGHQASGFAANEIPPSNQENGWRNIVYRFIAWLVASVQIIPGGGANSALTISGGIVTPTAGNHTVAAGTVNTIAQTNHNDGRLLLLHGTAAQTTIITNGFGGTGQALLSDGGTVTLTSASDYLLLQRDGTNWREVSRSVSIAGSGMLNGFGGRLTLASGVPITTSDQTAKTTIYLTPFRGGAISLWDGVKWVVSAFSEISLAVPATTSQMYDLFVYNNAGVMTLEAVAWTNDTTRATALSTQNGVYVKTGAASHLYVGSFRTTAVSGQTEDSAANRFLWNAYNRVGRPMVHRNGGSTVSWDYTSTWRQANADATNQLNFIVGLAEDAVNAVVQSSVTVSATGSLSAAVGIGVDSTTVDSSTLNGPSTVQATGPGNTSLFPVTAAYSGTSAPGKHSLVWLEMAMATSGGAVATWFGYSSSTLASAGIHGTVQG